jgi:deazaflavin-dependent oxidoreductase (nitroreductase family)
MADFDNPIDPPPSWQLDHLRAYVATDGAEGHDWRGAPALLLTTIGHRSGKARRTPLYYGRDAGNYLVVASKGGAPRDPAWYRNLSANPDVRVQVRGDRFAARARTADEGERARLWPVMTAIWPDYDAYQAKTDRRIPLVVLEPV